MNVQHVVFSIRTLMIIYFAYQKLKIVKHINHQPKKQHLILVKNVKMVFI